MVSKLGVEEPEGFSAVLGRSPRRTRGKMTGLLPADVFCKLNFCVKLCLRKRTLLLLKKNKTKRQ